MKVHKVVLYVIDFDELGADEMAVHLEQVSFPNDCISPNVISVETRDIGEWYDEHPLNFSHTANTQIQELFGKD